MTDGYRFSAPDQFGATQTKIPPAPDGRFTRFAVASSVPTFHRVDAEAIADRFSCQMEWLRKWRLWSSFDVIVTRNFQAQFLNTRPKLLNAPHPTSRWKLSHRC